MIQFDKSSDESLPTFEFNIGKASALELPEIVGSYELSEVTLKTDIDQL